MRRASCWLAAQPNVERTRLGVAGISLGGIVSALVASVDPAITEAPFYLPAAISRRSSGKCRRHAPFRKVWIDSGRTKADLKKLTDPFDPLTYASGLAGKRMLDDRRQGRRSRPPGLHIAAVGSCRQAADHVV